MVTKRRFVIPIFDYKLEVQVFDRWDELDSTIRTEHESKGITASCYGFSVVAVNSRQEYTIIHEAEHVKNEVWKFIGYTPQRDNDEVDAYLVTYIAEKIYKVFKQHNS